MAASPDIVHSHITRWAWHSNNFPYCGNNNRDGVQIRSNYPGTGVRFTNTRSWTSITNVYAYFWFPKDNIGWVAEDPGNSGCWTVPTRSGARESWAGDWYYPYRSDYTCAITPTHLGTTVLETYNWRTPCYNETNFNYMRWARRTAYATVNGEVQPLDSGYFEIDGD